MSHKNLNKFQKKTQHQHVLDLPDTYIGSVDKQNINLWVFEGNKMIKKNVNISPGLYKIFDEVLVNACDHYHRLKVNELKGDIITNHVSLIKVDINKEEGYISIYNDGDGIPVAMHPTEKVYIPTLLFFDLLTSENYDKDEERTVGGKNGLGAKLANIYSTKYILETIDPILNKKFVQIATNNMFNLEPAKISRSNAKPYTKITFYPDLKRFGMNKLDDDIISLMTKRVYDMTICTENTVELYFNGNKINCASMDRYVDLFIGFDRNSKPRFYEKLNDRWELIVCTSPDEELEQVSFVNGIYTFKGGKHVEAVANMIAKKLQLMAKKGKKYKELIKQEHIKKNLWIFLRATIVNPSFDSQTKENLTTPTNKFGSTFDISELFIKKLYEKTDIMERSFSLGKHKQNIIKIENGTKSRTIRGIPKLDDANWAGTTRSQECTLILTEGDSAKALAVAGLSVVGRDKYGVFPLKGKGLNVRGVSKDKIEKNEEIKNLIKILGIRCTEKGGQIKYYNDTKNLRYGHIMYFTDQDYDGYHIKGLGMNFIKEFNCGSLSPLMKIKDFVQSLKTPIVKATKGKQSKEFYSIPEYNKWKETNPIGWKIKYYKGLATSDPMEGKEYFKDIDSKRTNYCYKNEDCFSAIDLAFDKKKANERKEWLKNYDPNNVKNLIDNDVSYEEFINNELIQFSNDDCSRSIPSLCDGLKPSQRKVLYGCFKRNLTNDIKVAQLAGYISEHTAYHHGEVSLQGTIIGMAQNFVGSNNINELFPAGMFGTRLLGGKDSGAPRYIYTKLRPITSLIYNQNDMPLYLYQDDDGMIVEPYWYLPIIPMILVNGCVGIGTGFSANIPSFNPLDIIQNIKYLMQGDEPKSMIPWYRGFKGEIIFDYENNKYKCYGKYNFIDSETIEITELPIGIWTENYNEFLESIIVDKSANEHDRKKQKILSYIKGIHYSEINVHYIIKLKPGKINDYKNDIEQFLKDFKLQTNINTSNMHLYNANGIITKYENPEDILKDFYKIRLEYYSKRKIYLLNKLRKELDINKSKMRFLQEYIDNIIKLIKVKKSDVEKQLEERNYPKFSNKDISGNFAIKATDNIKENEEDRKYTYNYLLHMHISSLTEEKLEKLENECKLKETQFNTLNSKSENELWINDLDEFIKLYKKDLFEYKKENMIPGQNNIIKINLKKSNTNNKPSTKIIKKI